VLKVRFLIEEHGYAPWPDWVVEPEDDRLYEGAVFGRAGTAWATVFTVGLTDESHFLQVVSKIFPQLPINVGIDLGTLLELRVCSPSFREGDPRFLRDGKHIALVQDEFDANAVEQYCNAKIREVSKLRGPRLYRELERSFHLFDPDDD
jgi:hypothetical protein